MNDVSRRRFMNVGMCWTVRQFANYIMYVCHQLSSTAECRCQVRGDTNVPMKKEKAGKLVEGYLQKNNDDQNPSYTSRKPNNV